jgi:hypothetical protein
MGRGRQVNLKNGQGMTKSMSTEILHQYNKQPIHVRSRAEQWELPRTEIELTGKLGEGDGGVIFYAHWRGLDVVAKMLKTDADECVPSPASSRPASPPVPPQSLTKLFKLLLCTSASFSRGGNRERGQGAGAERRLPSPGLETSKQPSRRQI